MLSGERIGNRIVHDYKDGKVDLDRLTLIGHGLGSHVAGIAGKTVFKKLSKKVKMIIAASPVGSGFNTELNDKKLYKDDAKCVAVIHTNKGFSGYKYLTGGLEFYANGGSHQPGCNTRECLVIMSTTRNCYPFRFREL